MKITRRISSREAARLYTALPDRLIQAVMVEGDRLAEVARDELIEASSGTLTHKEMRRMGHPFARRAPQTPMDPAKINDHGKGFKRAWRVIGPRKTGKRVRAIIRNSHPDAKWIVGSTKPSWGGTMVARPIIAATKERFGPIHRRSVLAVVHKTLRDLSL